MKPFYFKVALMLLLIFNMSQIKAAITVITPNGGEVYSKTTQTDFVIQVSGPTTVIDIEYSLDGGITYQKLTFGSTSVIPNSTNTLRVSTPNTASVNCLIRVTSVQVPSDVDVSDAVFTVVDNSTPYAIDSVLTKMNIPVTFSTHYNDDYGDLHLVTALTSPSHGTVVQADDSSFTYTPDLNFIGLDTFSYRICDNGSPSMCGGGFASIYVGCEQLLINPGKDSVTCAVSGFVLGGNPTVSGGTPPYDYGWGKFSGAGDLVDYNVPNPVINNLNGPVKVALRVIDAAGCIVDTVVNITGNTTGFTIVQDNIQDESCAGNDGGINISVNGSGPFTYNWNMLQTVQDVSGLAAGTYTVTVTAASGCMDSKTFTVGAPVSGFTINLDSIRYELCGNPTTGYLGISVSGSGAPFNYLWSTGAVTTTLDGLVAGTYIVTVSNSLGCTETKSFIVGTHTGITVNGLVTNIGCSPTGGIDITVNGGTPPYTYTWSNGQTIQDIQGVNTAGTYLVTVTDNAGCVEERTYSISQSAGNISAGFPEDTILCSGDSATLYFNYLYGGVWPYTIEWTANGIALPDTGNIRVKPTVSTVYIVSVTDFSGCKVTDTVRVTVSSDVISFKLDSIVGPGCSLPSGAIYITTGSTALPLIYEWSNGIITEDNTTAAAGWNSVRIRNASGCWMDKLFNVPYPLSVQILNGDSTFCNIDTVKLYGRASGGSGPYTYSWQSSLGYSSIDSDIILMPISYADYTLQITDAKGCSATANSYVAIDTCVWPGDANYDGIVNSDDVLNIGLAYGAVGNFRSGFINWGRYKSADWEQFFATGLDYEHADCNGNSVINHDDTLAVTVNYSLTHNRSGWVNGTRMVDPRLFTTFPVDTVYAGGVLTARVQLGESTLPATDVFGISFRMNFPSAKVESFRGLDFNGNWITAGNSNPVYFRKVNLAQGYVDICLVRTDNTDKTGFGLVANADFVMKDDITGKNDNRTFATFPVSYSNVKMISASEAVAPVFADESEAVLAQFPLGVKNINEAQATVYPNPVHQSFVLVADGVLKEVLLINSIGEQVHIPAQIKANTASMDASELAAGVYYLHLTTANGKAVKRIVKY